jgi:glycosyltransferase involved in cell wall biosynthesis
MNNFSIIITTYNRLDELKFTLNSLETLIDKGVKIIICNDGSTDGTSEFLEKEYPQIRLLVNPVNKGLIYSRNLLMNHVKTPYAISLDDDANFMSSDPLGKIAEYFRKESACGVIAFRIYWAIERPKNLVSSDRMKIVKSFVGCGHVWRMQSWKEIPAYPEWYQFYGEETFASIQLFKKNWEVHYLPSILVHHRVDNKARKKDKDYYLRARRSLRADWYNYIIFYPNNSIFRLFLSSIKSQILKASKTKDIKVINNLFLVVKDLLKNSFRLIKNRNNLTNSEYQEWKRLPDAKIYWDYKK